MKFKLTNLSGISTHFDLSMEKFFPVMYEDEYLMRQQAKEDEMNRLNAEASKARQHKYSRKTTKSRKRLHADDEIIPITLTEK